MKSQNKIIISVSSADIIYCLSIYESGDVILTPYKAIQNIYSKLGIKTKQTRFLFLAVLFSKRKFIFIFGQGPTFFLLYFRKVFLLLKKEFYYSDAYLKMQSRMVEPSPILGFEDYIHSYFPDWLQRFLGFGLFNGGSYYWLQCCFIIADPIVPINNKFTINCANCIIILDEILILFPNLLDFKRMALKYPLYLKRKSRSGGMIEVNPDVLELFTEHTDTIVPIELYSGYHAIIGNNSTALKMPKSISVCKIIGQPNYYSEAFIPESLEELYLYLAC